MKRLKTILIGILIAVGTWLAITLFGCSIIEDWPEIKPTPAPTATPTVTVAPTPSPTQTATPTIPPVQANPRCSGILGSLDGPGGFLLKNGDHTGKVVVLLPGRFKKPFGSVTFERKNGERSSLTFSGWGNPDSAGDRQHWRHPSLTVANVKDGSLVVASEAGNTCSWLLPDPIRNNRVD